MTTRTMLALFALALGASAVTAATASIDTPPSSAAGIDSTATPDDLKPSACASITLTALVTGSGTVTGTAANELILGSAGADVIDGQGGDDCIMGGAGDDDITGGADTDVCIGGGDPGDIFTGCETSIP